MADAKQKCLSFYEGYRAIQEDMLNSAARFSEDQRNQAAQDGGWSINQVLDHLYIVEKGILAYLKKKTSSPEQLEKATLSHVKNAKMLLLALKSPAKFKAPKILSSPATVVDSNSIEEPWRQTSNETLAFLNDTDTEILSKAVFRHPKVGLLSGVATFQFMKAHIARHQKQFNRLVLQLW